MAEEEKEAVKMEALVILLLEEEVEGVKEIFQPWEEVEFLVLISMVKEKELAEGVLRRS